jgi:hypothetical protein
MADTEVNLPGRWGSVNSHRVTGNLGGHRVRRLLTGQPLVLASNLALVFTFGAFLGSTLDPICTSPLCQAAVVVACLGGVTLGAAFSAYPSLRVPIAVHFTLYLIALSLGAS